MHLECVFDHHHVFALHPAIAELSDGGVGVGEQALFISGVGPGASYHAGTIARADLVLVGVNQCVQRSTVDQSFFDEERFEGLDAEGKVRRNGLVIVIMSVGELGGQGCSCGGRRGRQEIAPICGHLPSSAVD